MRSTFTQAVLGAIAIAAAPFAATATLAETGPGQSQYPETRPTQPHSDASATSGDRHDVNGQAGADTGPRMSAAVSKSLKAVFDAAKKKDWPTAKAKLAEAQAIPGVTAFDAFEINVAAGYVAFNTGDHPGTLAAYKTEIANPLFTTALSAADQAATLRNAMILSNEAGDFTGAIGLGQKLIAMGSLDETSAIALATAYFATKDYANAQSLAQKAIDAQVAAGRKVSDTAAQIVLQSKTALH